MRCQGRKRTKVSKEDDNELAADLPAFVRSFVRSAAAVVATFVDFESVVVVLSWTTMQNMFSV